VQALVSKGVEAELEVAPHRDWQISAGYSYTPTRVAAPGEPVHAKEAIRAPRHMVTAALRAELPHLALITVEGRHVGRRFDNDLNTVVLGDFTLLNVRLSRRVGRQTTLQATAENLLDRRFPIARTGGGLEDMGAPRWMTLGVRTAW
jgi:outer membrane cobalamin receptor